MAINIQDIISPQALSGVVSGINPAATILGQLDAQDAQHNQAVAAAQTSAASTAANNNLAQYDSAIGQSQASLDRLASQLGIAKDNINNQYNTSNNELATSKTANQNTYNTNTTQNSQNLRSNKNTIADQQSSGLRGLLRTLGAYGAVGSDLGVAGGAVSDQASQQRAGAGQTFAQNQQGLDTSWNNYLGDFGNQQRKLEDWKTQQINSAQAQSETSKQSILQQLADLRGQRAAATGGSYTAAAQPLLNQSTALNSQIDNLGRINPTYDGTTPTYQAPTLNSYLASQAGQTTNQIQPTTANSPYLALLLGQQDKNKGLL